MGGSYTYIKSLKLLLAPATREIPLQTVSSYMYHIQMHCKHGRLPSRVQETNYNLVFIHMKVTAFILVGYTAVGWRIPSGAGVWEWFRFRFGAAWNADPCHAWRWRLMLPARLLWTRDSLKLIHSHFKSASTVEKGIWLDDGAGITAVMQVAL